MSFRLLACVSFVVLLFLVAGCKQKQTLDDFYEDALTLGQGERPGQDHAVDGDAEQTKPADVSDEERLEQRLTEALSKATPYMIQLEGLLPQGGWVSVTAGVIFDPKQGTVVTPLVPWMTYRTLRVVPHKLPVHFLFSPKGSRLALWQMDHAGQLFDPPVDATGKARPGEQTFAVGFRYGDRPAVMPGNLASVPSTRSIQMARADNVASLFRLGTPHLADLEGGLLTDEQGQWLGIVLPNQKDRMMAAYPMKALRAQAARVPSEDEKDPTVLFPPAKLERIAQKEAAEPTPTSPDAQQPSLQDQAEPGEENSAEEPGITEENLLTEQGTTDVESEAKDSPPANPSTTEATAHREEESRPTQPEGTDAPAQTPPENPPQPAPPGQNEPASQTSPASPADSTQTARTQENGQTPANPGATGPKTPARPEASTENQAHPQAEQSPQTQPQAQAEPIANDPTNQGAPTPSGNGTQTAEAEAPTQVTEPPAEGNPPVDTPPTPGGEAPSTASEGGQGSDTQGSPAQPVTTRPSAPGQTPQTPTPAPATARPRKPKVTLGIKVKAADTEMATRLGIPEKTLVVSAVTPGGPAEEAQLLQNDVLMEIAGQRITGMASLLAAMGNLSADTPAPIVVKRNGLRLFYMIIPKAK